MPRKPSLKQRIQYYTDNLMARGPQAMIGLLGVFSLIIILLSAFVVTIGGRIFFPEGVEDLSFIEAFWLSLVRTLDPGTMGADEGWGFRLIMLLLPTLGGVFIISTLIGVLSNVIQNKIEDLRKGRSLVLEENHTIILGWSSQVFTILSELVEANLNQVNSSIAILAMKEKVEMEDEIRSRLRDTKNTRIICRSGSPIDPAALELVRPQHARSIIVIPPEDHDPDNFVIKTVLAITNNPHRRAEAYNIVTQIRDEKNLQVVQMLGKKDRVCALLARDIIARVTAQTSRQSGLSIVYTELFNFSGDEIYFKEEKALTGKRYRDALSSYATSSVIGLFKADGLTAQLNPPMDSLIQPGDQLICISADDDTIIFSASPDSPAIESIQSAPQPISVKKERLLLLGWNEYGATILRELDNYVEHGSRITIVADETFQEKVSTCTRLKNQTIEFHAGDTTNRSLLDELKVEDYDHVIVLADTSLDFQEADARTLVTLLHLRDISLQDETPFSIVSEMLDLRNRELATVTKVDDFIVSTHLISLMIAQLSENIHLMPVFTDMLNEEGAEIYLKPVEEYIKTGVEVNFYTVMEAAARRNETAIGYRSASADDKSDSYGVHINPDKSAVITFNPGDKVIVFAE
jgi:voltage-gated potassium channel Kch